LGAVVRAVARVLVAVPGTKSAVEAKRKVNDPVYLNNVSPSIGTKVVVAVVVVVTVVVGVDVGVVTVV
jgi:hypothetical protein